MKCFTDKISRLVNCLSGYSDKVEIKISENEEISNIISIKTPTIVIKVVDE